MLSRSLTLIGFVIGLIITAPASAQQISGTDHLSLGMILKERGGFDPKAMPDIFCKIDPLACGGPPSAFDTSKLNGSAFFALKHGGWTQSPSPICQIDPCACKNCQENSGGIVGFEDAAGPAELTAAANLIGVEMFSRPAQIPSFNSPLGSGTPEVQSEAHASFHFDLGSAKRQLSAAGPDNILCNNAISRPDEYWRELLLRKTESEQCSDAAQIMVEQREKHQLAYFEILSGKLRKQDARTEFKVFDDYRNACIHEVSNIDDTAASKYSFGINFKNKVDDNVGELNFNGKDVHCTAAIVQYDAAGQHKLGLATAAHCIGDPIKGTSDKNLQFAAVHSEMKFTSFSGKSYAVDIDAGIRGLIYDKTFDAVIIPMTPLPAGEPTPDGFKIAGPPGLWQPLYIIGMNPFLAALNSLTANPDSGPLSASISLEPGCRVYGISGRVMYHNCQTERGMSGSPIFVTVDHEARIVAVHSGEVDSPTIAGCPEPTAGAANYGTLISP